MRSWFTSQSAHELANNKPDKEERPPTSPPREHWCLRWKVSISTFSSRLRFVVDWKRYLGSIWLSYPLTIAGLLLSVAWFVIVMCYVDSEVLEIKYVLSQPYGAWEISMFVLVPVMWCAMVGALCRRGDYPGRVVLCVVCAFYATMLIIGNCLAAPSEANRLASESEFAIEFNTRYCAFRLVRVCLEGGDDEAVLELTGRLNATTPADEVVRNSSESLNDVALSTWNSCKNQILPLMLTRWRIIGEDYRKREKIIATSARYQFLDDCVAAPDVDAWCGLLATQSLTKEAHRVAPAPFALNPRMFASYTKEWPRRMFYSNILLGSAVGCLVLGIGSFALQKPIYSHYRW